MKILITGGNGFIGSALALKLKQQEHEVFIFDVDNGDISNENALTIFNNKKIEHVYHLAACTFVPESWKKPHKFYNVNVLGTLHALEFSKTHKCSLTFMSSYVYGTPEYNPIDELHPVKAFNPYAHSKIIAEQLCNFYIENHGLKISIVRPFNIYGPGQAEHFLIPTILKSILYGKSETVEVLNDKPKRDYIFIDDITDALALILNDSSGVYNIGSGASVSVREIINIAKKITGSKKKIVSRDILRPNEVEDMVADTKKIANKFGWAHKTSITTGLTKCINSLIKPANAKNNIY